MSDRGLLFLFSILMIAAGLGAAAWMVATGQADTVDGLFLVLTALTFAASVRTLRGFSHSPRYGSSSQAGGQGCPAGAKSTAARPAAVGQVADLP